MPKKPPIGHRGIGSTGEGRVKMTDRFVSPPPPLDTDHYIGGAGSSLAEWALVGLMLLAVVAILVFETCLRS